MFGEQKDGGVSKARRCHAVRQLPDYFSLSF